MNFRRSLITVIIISIITVPFSMFTVPAESNALPDPWKSVDCRAGSGSDLLPAGSSSCKDGVFTLNGSGNNLFVGFQQFHYVYRPFSGDGEMVVRLTSFNGVHPQAKAGIQIREGLNGFYKYAAMSIWPNGTYEFEWNESGSMSNGAGIWIEKEKKGPHWLKLERKGNKFIGYHSDDAKNWVMFKTAYINMKKDVYIGMYVTPLEKDKLRTAIFDNVEFKEYGTYKKQSNETYLFELDKKTIKYDKGLNKKGEWTYQLQGNMGSPGTNRESLSVDFYGSGIKILGMLREWGGAMTVYIDDVKVGRAKFSGAESPEGNNMVVFEKYDLQDKKHTLKMVSNNAGWIYIDGFYTYSNMVTAKIPSYKTAIAGINIDNAKAKYPVLDYKETVYIPATQDICKALGLSTAFDSKKGFSVAVNSKQQKADFKPAQGGTGKPGSDVQAEIAKHAVTINGKLLDNYTEEYPVLVFNGVNYIPMTQQLAVKELGLSIKSDPKAGFNVNRK